MELIRGGVNIQTRHRGCVASIGNFDGVHLGHRAIVNQLRLRSSEFGKPGLIIVFEPQPQEYFRKDSAPVRLSPLRDKLTFLDALGVERVLCLRFNQKLAQTSAEDFIHKLLIERLGIYHLVVGDDFRFGRGRGGDFNLLAEFGERFGFSVESAETFEVAGERVSSTRIRQALSEGQLDLAASLLGRGFQISGRVTHGAKRGREWGFPTANIALRQRKIPFSGIFAVQVTGINTGAIPGVANLGIRPMIPGSDLLLEVYLLDFNENIYGKRVNVEFLKKLREEQKFDTVDALIQQIQLDVENTKQFFDGR